MDKAHIRDPKKYYMRIALIGIIVIALVFYLAGGISAYLSYLASAGIVTFVLYGFDKMQAKRNGDRVPEIILHLLALVGGFIGGWAGRFIFRHKTSQPVFLIMLILATVLHAWSYYYLYIH